jgi:hypothetical protein
VVKGLEPDADVLTIHIALQLPFETLKKSPRAPDHVKDQPAIETG